jgi:hypothetical protein
VFRERERMFGRVRQLDLLEEPQALSVDAPAAATVEDDRASAGAQTEQQEIDDAAEDEPARAPTPMVKRRAHKSLRRGGFVPGWR